MSTNEENELADGEDGFKFGEEETFRLLEENPECLNVEITFVDGDREVVFEGSNEMAIAIVKTAKKRRELQDKERDEYIKNRYDNRHSDDWFV